MAVQDPDAFKDWALLPETSALEMANLLCEARDCLAQACIRLFKHEPESGADKYCAALLVRLNFTINHLRIGLSEPREPS